MTINRAKTGGRKAGTPNRLTYQMRLLLLDALEGEIETLPDTLAQLEPSQRVDALCKLMRYVLPPMVTINPAAADRLGLKDSGEEVMELQRKNRVDSMLDSF